MTFGMLVVGLAPSDERDANTTETASTNCPMQNTSMRFAIMAGESSLILFFMDILS